MSVRGALLLSPVLAIAALFSAPSCATSGDACELNSDCLKGYCNSGTCTQDCVDSAKDCPKGYLCNTIGQCEFDGVAAGGTGGEAGEPSSGGSPSTGAAPADGGSTNDGGNTSTNDSAMGGQGGGTPSGDELLTLCSADGDCESGMCRPTSINAPLKRCTRSCSSNAQCPTGFRCEDIANEQRCAAIDIGRSCSGVGQCNFACLSPLNYCTGTCTSGADCPAGFGCMNVSGNKVCVKTSADCAENNAQCAGQCDSSLIVSSCTMPCASAADCPQRALALPSWTCDGQCRRPGDVFGPLPGGYEPAQWVCNLDSSVVNVCGDGLHIDFDNFSQPAPPAVNCASPTTTDGAPGDACLDSCRLRGGCPYGFGCAALGEVGNQSIGLCSPAGAAEVGATCNSPNDCVFSACEGNVCTRDCSLDGICPSPSACLPAAGANVEGVPRKTCQ